MLSRSKIAAIFGAMLKAADVIARFGLTPLPGEGGFFARSWTSSRCNPDGRPTGTAIYFLLTATDFSALHRLKTDEVWHFYAGAAVEHVQLFRSGLRRIRLGHNFSAGEVPQLAIPAGTWQGARLAEPREPLKEDWSLLGCTLAPGWLDSEFELGDVTALVREFPSCAEAIPSFVRKGGPA